MDDSLNTDTRAKVLTEWASSDDVRDRMNAAREPFTPVNTLWSLADDKESWVRCALASRENLPLDLTEKLLNDTDHGVRSAATANASSLPTEKMKELLLDENPAVRVALAGRKDLPQEIHEMLAKDEFRQVLERLTSNPTAPSHVLGSLVVPGISVVRDKVMWNIAKHPNTPASALQVLGQTENKTQFFHVLKNLNCPSSIIEEIVLDPNDFNVLEIISAHPNTPMSVLRELVEFPAGHVHVMSGLIQHPKMTIEMLEIVAKKHTPKSLLASVILDRLQGTTKYAGYPEEWLQEAVLGVEE